MRVLLPFLLLAGLSAAETIDLPCVADTSIVLYQGEERECHGAKPWIRCKGNQHLLALAFEVTPLKGRLVASAVLLAAPGEQRLRQVTISTIQAPWDEGKANALDDGLGHGGWGVPDVRFSAICGGNSGSLVCDAPTRDLDGRYA